MRLDQALVQRNLCESRQEAKECITRGFVLVDGKVVTKQAKDVVDESILTVTENRKFVSRGGDKLEGALIHIFGTIEGATSHIEGKSAIDIGSSTGGFTDCLLSHNIASVVAVDVGTQQLHPKLRDHVKISLFENTDIRNVPTDKTFDIIVADLSFIPLEKVIDTILCFGHTGSDFFLLIKPQFEVGKGNTKKGIVKDEKLTTDILEKYTKLLEDKKTDTTEVFPCVIKGGEGNQEYFLYVKRI